MKHAQNGTPHTLQCCFRVNLRWLFLRVGKICEYVRVLAKFIRGNEEYHSEEGGAHH